MHVLETRDRRVGKKVTRFALFAFYFQLNRRDGEYRTDVFVKKKKEKMEKRTSYKMYALGFKIRKLSGKRIHVSSSKIRSTYRIIVRIEKRRHSLRNRSDSFRLLSIKKKKKSLEIRIECIRYFVHIIDKT